MRIAVCVGSSCHLKGSRYVVEQLQCLLENQGFIKKVELTGTFCMGNCQNGVCVAVNDKPYSLKAETVEEFFEKEILPQLQTEHV